VAKNCGQILSTVFLPLIISLSISLKSKYKVLVLRNSETLALVRLAGRSDSHLCAAPFLFMRGPILIYARTIPFYARAYSRLCVDKYRNPQTYPQDEQICRLLNIKAIKFDVIQG